MNHMSVNKTLVKAMMKKKYLIEKTGCNSVEKKRQKNPSIGADHPDTHTHSAISLFLCKICSRFVSNKEKKGTHLCNGTGVCLCVCVLCCLDSLTSDNYGLPFPWAINVSDPLMLHTLVTEAEEGLAKGGRRV